MSGDELRKLRDAVILLAREIDLIKRTQNFPNNTFDKVNEIINELK